MKIYEILIVFLVASAIYIIFKTTISRAAQNARERVVIIAKILDDDENVPTDIKNHVEFLVDTLFGMKRVLIPAIFLMPAFIIVYAVRARLFAGFQHQLEQLSQERRALFDEMDDLHNRITLANHPILTCFVLIELIIFFVPSILLRAFAKGKLPTEYGARSVVWDLEEKTLRFFQRHGMKTVDAVS